MSPHKQRLPNKFTRATAGGPPPLAIREPWVARIAQFSRYLVDAIFFFGGFGVRTTLVGSGRKF